MTTLVVPHGPPLLFLGKDIKEGPLPALFYFSLSAHDSLFLAPFNTPAALLQHLPLRIFSVTLPGHEEGLLKEDAIRFWAEQFLLNKDPLTPFIQNTVKAIEFLFDSHIVSKLAFAGLSRGSYLACHVAARCPHVQSILGYAPLTDLAFTKEFHPLDPSLFSHLDLRHVYPELSEKTIRFYIGNRDKRVGTKQCFNCIQELTEIAFHKKIRALPFELILTPSIGYQGHGTSPHLFKEGADWINKQLLGDTL